MRIFLCLSSLKYIFYDTDGNDRREWLVNNAWKRHLPLLTTVTWTRIVDERSLRLLSFRSNDGDIDNEDENCSQDDNNAGDDADSGLHCWPAGI